MGGFKTPPSSPCSLGSEEEEGECGCVCLEVNSSGVAGNFLFQLLLPFLGRRSLPS